MKKVLVLACLIAFLCSAFAIGQPEAILPFSIHKIFAISQPPPAENSECYDVFSTTNVGCSGYIRQYKYCAPQLNTDYGLWTSRSENCSQYGGSWACDQGECIDSGIVQPGDNRDMMISLVGLGICGAVIYIVFFNKKRRNKK